VEVAFYFKLCSFWMIFQKILQEIHKCISNYDRRLGKVNTKGDRHHIKLDPIFIAILPNIGIQILFVGHLPVTLKRIDLDPILRQLRKIYFLGVLYP
jgi:hypothetical protein